MTRFQRLNLVFGLALLAVILALPLYAHSAGELRDALLGRIPVPRDLPDSRQEAG